MLSNRLAFAALAVACIAAAAGGSYVALRQNVASPTETASGRPRAGDELTFDARSGDQALVGDTALRPRRLQRRRRQQRCRNARSHPRVPPLKRPLAARGRPPPP
jgi:hypothetical protein